MNDKHGLIILAIILVALPVAGCTKHEDKVHESWVAPPEHAEVDDSTLRNTVKAALAADPEVNHLDIRIEADNGTVMLSGLVENQAQMDRALMLTWMVDGVKKVDNRISLGSGAGGSE